MVLIILMDKIDISLDSLVEGCEKYKFDLRIIIIPNSSNTYRGLTKVLDNKSIPYTLDTTKNPQISLEDCHVIDFREINLI